MELFFRQKLSLVAVGMGICLASLLSSEESFSKKEKDFCNNDCKVVPCSKDNPHRIELRHIEGDGIGYKKGYTTAELFLSQLQDENLVYFDGRIHLLNQGKWGFNSGIGYRHYFEPNDLIYGVNLFFDYRESKHTAFTQVGLGFETLGTSWHFRANGYMPVMKTKKTIYFGFDKFVGNNAFLREEIRQSMWGVDSELENRCYTHDKMDLDIAFGAYYFHGVKKRDTIGGKARARATFYDCCYGQAALSYDPLFHFNLQGEVGLSFSLQNIFSSKKSKENKNCSTRSCSCQKLKLAKRMKELPLRQDLIVLSKAHTHKLARNPEGVPYFFFHVNNLMVTGDGTAENPFPGLAQAELASIDGETIYVHFGDGTAYNQNSGITLKTNQRLLGSGVGHLISTTDGIIEITAQTPGKKPKLSNTDLLFIEPAVTLASGSEVSGFTITGARGSGVEGLHLKQGVKISNNSFFDNGDGGTKSGINISFDDGVVVGGTLEITDNLITSEVTGVSGIIIQVPQNGPCGIDVKINNNELISNLVYGLLISRTGTLNGEFKLTGEINNNTIAGNNNNGIFFSHDANDGTINLNLAIENNIITANSFAINFTRANGVLKINNNNIFTNRNGGVSITAGPNVAQSENLTIDLIGNELFATGGVGNTNLLVSLGFGRAYCRLIDTANRGPIPNKIWLDNNTTPTPNSNFQAEIVNTIGAMQLDNITLVP